MCILIKKVVCPDSKPRWAIKPCREDAFKGLNSFEEIAKLDCFWVMESMTLSEALGEEPAKRS